MIGDSSDRLVVAVDATDTPWCSTGVDVVADRLFCLGASAVSELTDEHDDGLGVGGRVRLVADLPAASLDLLDGPFEVLEHDPRWNDAWRDHATPIVVGGRFVLRPEWVTADTADRSDEMVDLLGAAGEPPDPAHLPGLVEAAGRADEDRIEVVLDAADAFGSGSHPTTRLCLEAIERLDDVGSLAGARVLDVGCGTGVLGVAALLVAEGASLVAIDVDPDAVAATRRTAELNGVTDRVVEVSCRTVAEVTAQHGPFDVVLANLLISIIEGLGTEIARAVAPSGHLVLSGLLADGATDHVDRALLAIGPLDHVEVLESDGWAVVLTV